jgi:nucleotide-binding universal stress UspA family protein
MRVLCCLDGTNAEQVSKTVVLFLKQEGQTFALLYVTDSGPHKEMELSRVRFLRPPDLSLPRRAQIHQAEEASAQDILLEGQRYLNLGEVEKVHLVGRPEREIVNYAASWRADLIIICPRSIYNEKPAIGPKSVGHVARFVLDHAPCPVLLARQPAYDQFPMPH